MLSMEDYVCLLFSHISLISVKPVFRLTAFYHTFEHRDEKKEKLNAYACISVLPLRNWRIMVNDLLGDGVVLCST
jgi:hypothetical protein